MSLKYSSGNRFSKQGLVGGQEIYKAAVPTIAPHQLIFQVIRQQEICQLNYFHAKESFQRRQYHGSTNALPFFFF